MNSFHNFYLYEGLLSFISKLFKRTLSKLKFGGKVSMKIPTSHITEDTNITASSIGYYAEWCVIRELSDILPKMLPHATVEVDQRWPGKIEYWEKKIIDSTRAAAQNAKNRADATSRPLAESIAKDILAAEDSKFFKKVTITHSGGSAVSMKKGGDDAAKADLVVDVEKMNEAEASRIISASLKSTTGFVTYLSSGTAAVINALIFDEKFKGRKNDLWLELMKEIKKVPDLAKDVEAVYNKWHKAYVTPRGTPKVKLSKDEKTTIANELGQIVFDRVFNYYYKKDHKRINSNLLKILGIDGADDVYQSIYVENKKTDDDIYIISSKSSSHYKSLYEKLRNDFEIVFTKPVGKNGRVVRTWNLEIKDNNGDVFWSQKIENQGGDQWKFIHYPKDTIKQFIGK